MKKWKEAAEKEDVSKEWRKEIRKKFKELKEGSDEWLEHQQKKIKERFGGTIKPLTELERMTELWKGYEPQEEEVRNETGDATASYLELLLFAYKLYSENFVSRTQHLIMNLSRNDHLQNFFCK